MLFLPKKWNLEWIECGSGEKLLGRYMDVNLPSILNTDKLVFLMILEEGRGKGLENGG